MKTFAQILGAVCIVGGIGAAVLLSGPQSSTGPTSDAWQQPPQITTQLHSAAALAAFCAHIGSTRHQKIVPCGNGASKPCCTEKEIQMEKMRSSGSTNFDWSNPNSWTQSSMKTSAAQHLAHKAAGISGMASPAAGWQNTAPAPQQQMVQNPQPQAQGYYPHLLPGQTGVPEQGVQAPPQYQQPYQEGYAPEYQQPYAPQQQMAYGPPQQPGYGTYVSPLNGPSASYGGQPAAYPQAQPQYAPQYPQQQVYQQPVYQQQAMPPQQA
eukprot:CAMPEP_0184307334 /NCGR_PEP_ID=MMETSP1049-20130417/16108_1 /TAXON_ID=77928 /ORGANISM="Proteomonas sulcata, Strain CCMP704" /LENGTH=265 /DNA_ID=CAMNT_0026619803 /DNA_START=9 /DNA_END=806 /DNA_ORIENTATION=+